MDTMGHDCGMERVLTSPGKTPRRPKWATLCGFVILVAALWPTRVSAAPPAEPELAIELPPMVVEDTSLVEWYYGKAPGLQVLSRCSTEFTRDFVRAHQRLAVLLQAILPAEYQVRFSAPWMLLLTNEGTTAATVTKLLEEAERKSREQTPRAPLRNAGQGVTVRTEIRMVPNLGLDDQDVKATFALVEEGRFSEQSLALTSAHVAMLLARRTPPLPEWLVVGILGVVKDMNYRSDSVVVEPTDWTSDHELKELHRDLEYRPFLLPMNALFAKDAKTDTVLWQNQVELFVRWSLESENAPLRPRFWKFVDRCCAGAVTEEDFRACFGFGYAEMRRDLGEYLPRAVRHQIKVKPVKALQFAKLALHRATAEEMARVTGEWDRLSLSFVRAHHPEFVGPYETQLRSTLRKVAALNRHDGQLMAMVGLSYCDQGDENAALPYLEWAIAAQAARPRVYVESARIRLAKTVSTAGPGGAKLDAAKSRELKQLLASARKLNPPMPETYILTVDTLLNSELAVEDADVAVMEEAVRLFPSNATICLKAAALHAATGHKARAEELIQRGLEVARDEPTRWRLLRLRGQ
jgi:hypothetical protein